MIYMIFLTISSVALVGLHFVLKTTRTPVDPNE